MTKRSGCLQIFDKAPGRSEHRRRYSERVATHQQARVERKEEGNASPTIVAHFLKLSHPALQIDPSEWDHLSEENARSLSTAEVNSLDFHYPSSPSRTWLTERVEALSWERFSVAYGLLRVGRRFSVRIHAPHRPGGGLEELRTYGMKGVTAPVTPIHVMCKRLQL